MLLFYVCYRNGKLIVWFLVIVYCLLRIVLIMLVNVLCVVLIMMYCLGDQQLYWMISYGSSREYPGVCSHTAQSSLQTGRRGS